MLTLFCYPVAVEPLLGLREQASTWACAFGLLGAMVVVCSISVLRNRSAEERDTAASSLVAVRWCNRLRWTALAFVPSGLLLGVTPHLTTDVAAAPFLCVLPLGLYALSFGIVFARRPLLDHRRTVALQPWLLVALAFIWVGIRDLSIQLVLHLATPARFPGLSPLPSGDAPSSSASSTSTPTGAWARRQMPFLLNSELAGLVS